MNIRIKILFFISFCLIFLKSNSQTRIQELSAIQYNQNVVVSYLISAGNSCSGYQILRSNDSLNFDVIYDYAGVCGESTKSQSITFTDESPQKNSKNYYKVLIQPTDYSNVVSVFFNDLSKNGYLLLENPTSNKLMVLCGSITKTLKIYSQSGDFIQSIFPNEEGLYQQDITSLTCGLYFFIIENNTSIPLKGKFIKK